MDTSHAKGGGCIDIGDGESDDEELTFTVGLVKHTQECTNSGPERADVKIGNTELGSVRRGAEITYC